MRKLITAVLVVATLLVAADFGAAAVAEHTVATRLRERLGLPSDPSVRINGFPFLTQALAGRYGSIDVRASGVSVDQLHDLDVEATLYDVDAPASEVISGHLQSVRVGRVEGRVRVKDSDLGRAIGINDLQIQQPSEQEIKEVSLPGAPVPILGPDNGPDNGVPSDRAPIRLVATINFAGQPTEVIGLGVIELIGGVVRITTRDVRLSRDGGAEVGLPSGIRQTVLKTLSTDVKPGGLPFAVTPTKVWVQTGSVVVAGTATDVTLGRPATA
ncbi:MAG: LmeA family phospholipid-binding protein [Pseudonocardiaceae bacterium]